MYGFVCDCVWFIVVGLDVKIFVLDKVIIGFV